MKNVLLAVSLSLAVWLVSCGDKEEGCAGKSAETSYIYINELDAAVRIHSYFDEGDSGVRMVERMLEPGQSHTDTFEGLTTCPTLIYNTINFVLKHSYSQDPVAVSDSTKVIFGDGMELMIYRPDRLPYFGLDSMYNVYYNGAYSDILLSETKEKIVSKREFFINEELYGLAE